MSFLHRLLGDPNTRELKKLWPLVEAISGREKHFEGLSDDRLREAATALRVQVNGDRSKLDGAMVDAFALVREAARRTLGQRHFDEQLLGGIILHQGRIAELRTGEGKTLAATAPLFLNALAGKGVHLVTVNDYLARRDTVWMGRIFHLLGMSVACIQHESSYQYDPTVTESAHEDVVVRVDMQHLRSVSRRDAYAADILYGTNNEFGFDYLRDNMAQTPDQVVQRPLSYAIIDEVDSILIDEARTPLIISAPAGESTDRYQQLARLVRKLVEGTHYNIDEKMRTTTLTQEGIAQLAELLGEDPYTTGNFELVHHIDAALKALRNYERDKHYVVKDGEVIIVDEFTGRLMPGRRFSEGLHQAIEAKEDVPIKQESKTMATITFQNFFRLYERIAGMTGTAATEEEEFMKIYGMDVMVVPTHRPMVRRDLQDKVFKTESGKLDALVRDVRALHEQGQPVLIGTISIDHNEILSERLTRAGVPHEVLNAKNHEREAQVISQAGKAGAVTVATNMAGRGVDIILGGVPRDDGRVERVRELGGLVVIGSERHESRRIDNQLRGRSGRQGDPGMSQFYVSMEDDLMRIFGSERMQGLMQRLGIPDDMPIENGLISRSIETAQKKVEGYNFDIRKHLVEYDDVVNRHRTVIYRRRKKILDMPVDSEYLRHEILHLVEEEIEQVVSFHTATDDEHQWDIEEIYDVVDTIFPIDVQDRVKMEDIRSHAGNKRDDAESRTMLIRYLTTLARKRYAEVEQRVADARIMRETERQLMLRTIDALWITHLDQMEYLRTGIGLRGYGQRDPLIEYKKEAYGLFTQLMSDIQSQTAHTIYKVGDAVRIAPPPTRRTLIEQAPEKTMSDRSRQFAFAASGNIAAPAQGGAVSSTESPRDAVPKTRDAEGKKVGRNDPCPCGSGKKYKKCHGQ